MTNVFQVQGQIAGQVAEALELALGAKEKQTLAERPTQNLAAYDAYLRGNEIFESLAGTNIVSTRRALFYYEQAVALDSTFAMAWAQLSHAHSSVYVNGSPSLAVGRMARSAAERAIALAPERPEGRIALGFYFVNVPRDHALALKEFAAALADAPNNSALLTGIGVAERELGHWDAAIDHLRQAQRPDPRSISADMIVGVTLLWLRRYPEALEAISRVLALRPAMLKGLHTRMAIFLAQGDLAGAQEVLRNAPKEVEPTALVALLATYGDFYWVLTEAQQQLLLRLTQGLSMATAAFGDSRSPEPTRFAGTRPAREPMRTPPERRWSKLSPPPPMIRSCMCTEDWRSPIWAARPRRSRKANAEQSSLR